MKRSNWTTTSKQSIAVMLVKKPMSNNAASSAYANQRRQLLPLPEISVQSADDAADTDDDYNKSNNYHNNNNDINNYNNNNNNINNNNNNNNNDHHNNYNCSSNSGNKQNGCAAVCVVCADGGDRSNGRNNNIDAETFLNMTEKEEARNLQVEFEWVLRGEVHAILKQLRATLIECAHRFPVPLYENEGKKTEKFVLSVSPEQLKAIVTLTGDTITQADISFKLAKAPHHIQRTSIMQKSPWKLQQVQDAANYLQQAINHIDEVHDACHFKTSDEVLHVIGNILEALRRGRTSLVIPKKKSIDELIKGRNMKSLAPNLSEDLAVSFYLQSHKLIIAIYQLTNIQGTMRFDSYQAEASVQWLNEVLLMLTAALKLCQQLKDKISVFSLYKDFTVDSRSPSVLSCCEHGSSHAECLN